MKTLILPNNFTELTESEKINIRSGNLVSEQIEEQGDNIKYLSDFCLLSLFDSTLNVLSNSSYSCSFKHEVLYDQLKAEILKRFNKNMRIPN